MRLGMVENGAADTFGAVLADEVRAFDVLFDVGGDLRERLLAGVLLRDVNEGAVLAAQLAEVAASLERVLAVAAEHGDHFFTGVFYPCRAV